MQGMFVAALRISAMRTFRARLQTIILTVRALDKVSLWSRKYINYQAKNTGKHDKDHPHHGTVHTARLGVARNPNEQCDIQDEDCDGNKNHHNHASTADTASSAGFGCTGLSAALSQHVKAS
jgi:hypothetical protein